MQISNSSPPFLDMSRVIAYAVLDSTVQCSGKQTIFVDGKLLGPVPKLALCENLGGDLKDILVFHCNDDWTVLGVSGAKPIEDAKASAERAYRGITPKWVATNVTEEEARTWIKENCDLMVCSFCDRLPGDYEQLIESKSGARVCNHCIDEHYQLIHEPTNDNNVA